jgi:hypothetical protein
VVNLLVVAEIEVRLASVITGRIVIEPIVQVIDKHFWNKKRVFLYKLLTLLLFFMLLLTSFKKLVISVYVNKTSLHFRTLIS